MRNTICGRPGCGFTKQAHWMPGACNNFIASNSKEANALKRAHLSVVETPIPEVIEDDPTAKVGHVTDAQLMAEWRARAAVLGVLA